MPYHTSRRARNNGDAFSAVNCTVLNTRALVRAKPLRHVRLAQNIIMRLGKQLSHAVATLNPDIRNGSRKKFEWPNRGGGTTKRGKNQTRSNGVRPWLTAVQLFTVFGSTAICSRGQISHCFSHQFIALHIGTDGSLIYHSCYMQNFNSCLVDTFTSNATSKRTPSTVFWVNTIINRQQTNNCGFYEVFKSAGNSLDGRSGGVCQLRRFGIFKNVYSRANTNSKDRVNSTWIVITKIGMTIISNRNKLHTFLLYLESTVLRWNRCHKNVCIEFLVWTFFKRSKV